ncbi:hypothetical protein Tc00.1047053503939.70 [Trypanosoma cruzi]|uniref:Uncharacterized protein n=1 Tax=Trypanosoma cruzi (strain CL Brener) TaxID=353153 RepID=Q4DLK6_TRYCC|nr:hypothetical protein Tc00.1047053503939.70 [Trypanosoma cruzi]EAN93406.1 hypothetical protein Tc00.1047053503939.70 [Trypanosoma cruzi]|eukprot:XP_815257.1 hypothetical protein [Trypanosoma cruzi strain CL Brener]
MEKEVVFSKRIQQLCRRIDRARPVFEQHASGELRVLSEAQSRQVEMYPLWLEDLEHLRQGRPPPLRPSKLPNASIKAPDGATSQEELPARDTAVVVGTESRNELELADDVAAQRSEEGSATVEKNGNEEEEVMDERGSSQQQSRCTESKKRGNAKKQVVANGFVGNFESEKERVVEHLRSLPPAARETFICKYLRKINDADELRILKKRFESANNLRQKMISGDVSCPSKSQLEIIKGLPELRRTLSRLKRHAKMEERRAMKFFLQLLEEIKEEEEWGKQPASIVLLENEDEKRDDENGATETSANGETAPDNSTVEEITETHVEMQLPIVNTLAAEQTDSAIKLEGNFALIRRGVVDSSGNENSTSVQTEFKSEGEANIDPSLSGHTSLCGNNAVRGVVVSPRATHEVGPSSTGDRERDRIYNPLVDCSNFNFSKNGSRPEIKALHFNQVNKKEEQEQQQQKQRENDGKKSEGLIRSDDESAFIGTDQKTREMAKQKVLEMPSHITREELGFIQLHIPIFYRCKASEGREQSAHMEELEPRTAAVLRRVEKELQYILQHPIPNVTVINSQLRLEKGKCSHAKIEAESESITLARWNVYVSPSDGPLAGQLLHIVVDFSQHYPFVPPLIYSTLFLPLTTMMVSESGQPNTIRLFSTCAPAVAHDGKRLANKKCTIWCPESGMHEVFSRLPSFFDSGAFAASREALGKELYGSSVAEARLACGRSAVEFLMGNGKVKVPTPTTIEMVNGPFLVYAPAAGDAKGEKKKYGNSKIKGKKGAFGSETVQYYEDGDRGVIQGPFRGCWGHLLQMQLPFARARRNQKRRSKKISRGLNGPVVTARVWARAGEVFPELELVAISEQSAISKELHWAESVLGTPRTEGPNGEKNQQPSGSLAVIAHCKVKLTALEDRKGAVVRFFVEEEEGVTRDNDENGKRNLPRCENGDQAGVTHVYLPRSCASLSPEGEETSLSWAIVIYVGDGCSATVAFSVPAVGSNVEDVRNAMEAGTHVSDVALDLVAGTVSDSAERTFARRISSCYDPASLFCVASLAAGREAGILGVLCKVIYPSPSTHSFVPENVVVFPRLILSENAFDAHFLCGMKKLFFTSSPFSPCTFFLPLTAPHETLPHAVQNRLKLSLTQVQRNPDASTAYAPPFKEKWALRFFVLALRSLGDQAKDVHDAGEAKDETRESFLHSVYKHTAYSFTQLVRGEAGLQKLCHFIAAGDFPLDRPSATRTSHKRDAEELEALEWLLASWSIRTGLVAFEAENNTNFIASSATTSKNTILQPTREDWHATTNKLMASLNESKKKDLLSQIQLHANFLYDATSK